MFELLIVASLLLLILYWPLIQVYRVARTNTKGTGFISIFKNPRSGEGILRLLKKNQNYDGFVHTWTGSRLTLLAVDPESAKFVLRCNNIQKNINSVFVSAYVGKNLGKHIVSAENDDWKRHRTLVSFGFNSKAYESYYPTFVSVTKKGIALMTEVAKNGNDLDCHDFISKMTIDLLGNSIFHYDFGRLEGKIDQYYNCYQNIMGFSTHFFGLLVSFLPFLDALPVPQSKSIHDSVDNMKSLFLHMIDERKSGKKYGDILEKLLEATGSELSQLELFSNLWAFFIAGHETTATALSYAFICLSNYPTIQERIYQEVVKIVGPDTVPTLEDLDKLEYMDCFINEILRLHTPIKVLTTRVAIEDVPYNNQLIPKGSLVGIGIDAIHRNPKYWPDPEKFDPDRFLPENKKGRNHFAFLPFSLGPRQCIGNNFSLIEQRLFLVCLLQNFRVLPPHHSPPYDLKELRDPITIGFNKPVHIFLERRMM
jgi:cytochrome P450